MAAGRVATATIAASGEKPRPPAKASRGHSTQTMHRIAVVKPSSPKLALGAGYPVHFCRFSDPDRGLILLTCSNRGDESPQLALGSRDPPLVNRILSSCT